MSTRETYWPINAIRIATLSLVLFLSAGLAGAQNSSANIIFLLASGFLCDTGESGGCAVVTKSPNGGSYRMSGAGAFNTQTKSASAAGTFTHETANGAVLETGVWIASQLGSFTSYGIAPATLMHEGRALGAESFGRKSSPIPQGPMPTGGLAVFSIRLIATSGAVKTAQLDVNCALGDVPRERSVEGIRLNVEKNGGEFSEEVSGRVMFLAIRPEASAPAKTPQQEPAPDSAEPPVVRDKVRD